MKIEVGKFYKNAAGGKAEIVYHWDHGNNASYRVLHPDGLYVWHFDDGEAALGYENYDLLEEWKKPEEDNKFKVGDRIVVTRCTGVNKKYSGSKGTVERVHFFGESSCLVHVCMDNYKDTHLYYVEEVELLEEKEPIVEYKVWSDMTAEEKGALLLAHHEGKTIEYKLCREEGWDSGESPLWLDSLQYRVAPEEKTFNVSVLCGEDETPWFRPSGEGIEGVVTVTYEDGNPTKMVWVAS